MPYSWISWKHFLNWGSFLCDDSSLCQVHKQKQTVQPIIYWIRVRFVVNDISIKYGGNGVGHLRSSGPEIYILFACMEFCIRKWNYIEVSFLFFSDSWFHIFCQNHFHFNEISFQRDDRLLVLACSTIGIASHHHTLCHETESYLFHQFGNV